MHKNNQKIAYLDFDGTLVKSHCVHYLILIQSCIKHPLIFLIWRLLLWFRAPVFLLLNKISAAHFDRYYYRFFMGISVKQLDDAVNLRVLDFLHSRFYPEAADQVQQLHAAGYQVVVVSGSMKNIVEPFARSIGADACLATEPEVIDGLFSGKINGNSINHQQKVRAIQDYQLREQLAPAHTLAIGNSKWDIPMLTFADKAMVVNPDKILARWAEMRGTPIKRWYLEKIPVRFYFLYMFLLPFIRTVEGLRHIPRSRGAIIIANHCSYLDHYLIGLSVMCEYGRRVRFLAKKEHFEKPFDRWIHEWLGAFPIDRSKASKESLLNVVKLLNRNELVLIYPEGTRSLDGKLQEFKPGVLFIQQKSGCEIIPTGIRGAYDFLPSGKLIPRPARMSLRFDKAITFSEQNKDLSRGELRALRLNILRDKISTLCEASLARPESVGDLQLDPDEISEQAARP